MRPDAAASGARADGGRPAILHALSVAAALVLLPLGLGQPGLPMSLGPDQATHLGAAASLALDGDLRCTAKDVDRLFQTLPYGGSLRLALRPEATTAPIFAADPLFTLLAAPAVALFGVGGGLATAALAFVTAIVLVAGLGFGLGRRRARPASLDDERVGLAFALAFLFASAAFVYAFRLHPATLHAALVAAAFALRCRGGACVVASGLALGSVVVPVPGLLPLAAGLVVRDQRPDGGNRLRWIGGFLAGLAVALGLAALVAAPPFTAPGPTGDDAVLVSLDTPLDSLDEAIESARLGDVDPSPGEPELPPWIAAPRTVGKALVERRSGLLPYFPFVLPILAAAFFDRRSGRRRRLVDGLAIAGAVLAIAFLDPVGADDPGGASFADPRFVALYPAFAFLLVAPPGARSRGRRSLVLATGVVLGTLALGPAFVSVLGPAMAWGGPQGHTRGLLAHLPLAVEHLGRGGEYVPHEVGPGLRLWLPRHAATTRGDEVWVLGGTRSRLYLDLDAERLDPDAIVLQLRSLAAENAVRVALGDTVHVLRFAGEPPGALDGVDGSTRRTFELVSGYSTRSGDTGSRRVVSLVVDAEKGVRPEWLGDAGLDGADDYYLGLGLAVLGPPDWLERDVFAVRWLTCGAPENAPVGGEIRALARLVNASDETWPATGAARVRLGYRWFDESGRERGGDRVDLRAPVAPGEEVTTWLAVAAPGEPGRFDLQVEPIFENVAWFADRGVEPCRRVVEITRSQPASEAQSTSGEGSSGTR